jgi:hypothetical protein
MHATGGEAAPQLGILATGEEGSGVSWINKFPRCAAPCGDADAEEILVLRPDRPVQCHRQGDQGPVVYVPLLNALPSLRLKSSEDSCGNRLHNRRQT